MTLLCRQWDPGQWASLRLHLWGATTAGQCQGKHWTLSMFLYLKLMWFSGKKREATRDTDASKWEMSYSGDHRQQWPSHEDPEPAGPEETAGVEDAEAALLPWGRLGLGRPPRRLPGPQPRPRHPDCPRLHCDQFRQAKLYCQEASASCI